MSINIFLILLIFNFSLNLLGQNSDSLSINWDSLHEDMLILGYEFSEDESCNLFNEIILATSLFDYHESFFNEFGLKTIRVFDLTKNHIAGYCRIGPEASQLLMRIENDLIADINTGRSLDVFISEIDHLNESTLKVTIFYFDILKRSRIRGIVKVQKLNGGFKVKNFHFNRYS